MNIYSMQTKINVYIVNLNFISVAFLSQVNKKKNDKQPYIKY